MPISPAPELVHTLLPKPVPGTDWHKARLLALPAPVLAPGAPPGGGDREVLRRGTALGKGCMCAWGPGLGPLPVSLSLGNLVGWKKLKHWVPPTVLMASSIF